MTNQAMTKIQAWTEGIDPKSPEFEAIADKVWLEDLPVEERIALIFELYTEAPSYGILMRFWLNYSADPARTETIDKQLVEIYLHLLGSKDMMEQDAAFSSLYYDIFEQEYLASYFWPIFMQSKSLTEELNKVLFSASGPVPWNVKYSDFVKQSSHKKYHLAIYLAIRHAMDAQLGKIDLQQAADLFVGLNLEANMDEIEEPQGHSTLSSVELRLLK
jgi:hypothetical protein